MMYLEKLRAGNVVKRPVSMQEYLMQYMYKKYIGNKWFQDSFKHYQLVITYCVLNCCWVTTHCPATIDGWRKGQEQLNQRENEEN